MSDEQMRRAVALRQLGEISNRKLRSTIHKKMQTTFIGAIASFEKFFGQIWGHDNNDASRTDSEKAWAEVWKECRKDILDKGNSQIKGMKAELNSYDVYFNKKV